MKKYTIFCTIYCIVICIICGILIGGNSTNSITVQPVRMLVTGMQGAAPCILEVYPNGILEATSGALSLGTTDGSLDSREYFANDAQRKWKKLSKKECSIIDALIGRILVECDEEYVGGYVDMGMVYMVIDDKDYMSLYSEIDSHIRMENKAVSELAHELVGMSPINLTGWEE